MNSKRTRADEGAYQLRYAKAWAYLCKLEGQADPPFTKGTLSDASRGETSRRVLVVLTYLVRVIPFNQQFPTWWRKAITAAGIVDDYCNNHQGKE